MLSNFLEFILVRKSETAISIVVFVSILILSLERVNGEDPLIELRVQNQKYFGKRLIHDYDKVVLMLRDGEIKVIPLSSVTKFGKTAEIFKPFSILQMRTELEREFGNVYEVKSNNTFIVVAPPGDAEKYLTICHDVHRSFYHYFVSRGIKLKELEFPLVVIILKDHQSFLEYGKSKGIKEINVLTGLYHPSSNRIVMHDEDAENKLSETTEQQSFLLEKTPSLNLSSLGESKITLFARDYEYSFGELGRSKTIEETVSHEVTHQIAFNSNLHSRVSDYPRWVIEGLAMTFETPGNRSNSKQGSTMDRVNLERYLHFKSYMANTRPSQNLEKFLFSEEQFKDTKQIFDAYAESWALTFYLIETRPADYGKYLQLLLKRPAYSFYRSSERVNDFKSVFGNNLSIFEVQYLKYYHKLY